MNTYLEMHAKVAKGLLQRCLWCRASELTTLTNFAKVEAG